MGARDRIGAGLARASLAVARRLGVSFAFSHRGAAGVTLYGKVVRETIGTARVGDHLVEGRVIYLEVPIQAGFAVAATEAEPVTPGDKITLLTREYAVLDPLEKDWTGYVYLLRLMEEKTLSTAA